MPLLEIVCPGNHEYNHTRACAHIPRQGETVEISELDGLPPRTFDVHRVVYFYERAAESVRLVLRSP